MTPDIAIIVSTFQRPEHLRRSLVSLAAQHLAVSAASDQVAGRIEVVVADDGSSDATRNVVEDFARQVEFPVRFVTHPHQGFQLARCRNEGAAAAMAPRLLFLDGDCLIPPGHIAQFLRLMRPGTVYGGYCVRLDEATSQRITEQTVRQASYVNWAPPEELQKLRRLDAKARFYNLIRHPLKPRLFGGNIGIFREDFERINGFDESFRGWGCEDDDFRVRLRQANIGIRSILRWTRTYHLWHPPAPSKPRTWREGVNVVRQRRQRRLTRCINGLGKRSLGQMQWQVVGQPALPEKARSFVASLTPHGPKPFWACETHLPKLTQATNRPNEFGAEVEVLFWPGKGGFSRKAQYCVLVMLDDAPVAPRLARRADVVLAPLGSQRRGDCVQLEELDKILRAE